MIPIRDENPTRLKPVVTVGIIVANVAVYAFQFMLPLPDQERFVYVFGSIPALVTRDFLLLPSLPAHWATLFTSMFVHGGLFHLGGNMLYLWIFGNNIEDHLGHVRFVFFYLVCGLTAGLSHVVADPASTVPMVGASGAISGVLGAYLLLYPRARVQVLVWFFFFVRFVYVPAFLVLGIWFIMQLTGVLGSGYNGQGGIAWFAHIGGFLAGMILVHLFGPTRSRARWYL